MEKLTIIITASVVLLIVIGIAVSMKSKTSTGPQAHVDSATDSANQAAAASAAAADAAANAATPQEAAAATQHAADASAVAQQAADSANQTAQQTESGTPVPDVDCVLNDWGAYGPCITDSTGQSFTTRLRTIKVQPSGNGKACDTLVDKSTCLPLTVGGNNPCAGFTATTAPSAANPIPLECHQAIWKQYCSIPLVEKDWAPNYRTFPSVTMKWLDDDAKARSTSPTWTSHCNPTTTSTTTTSSATTSGSSDPCAGYTAGSAANPIPLACHQAIWKTKCSKPLVESDWAPNYRTLSVVTVDWLKQDAAARSTDPTWKSHCN